MSIRYVVYTGNLPKYKIGGCRVVIRVRVNKDGIGKVLSPKEFAFWWPAIYELTEKKGWVTCTGPARKIEKSEEKEFVWQLLVTQAFILADLPEVEDSQSLSSGLLPNLDIAECFRGNADGLEKIAYQASLIRDVLEKRRFMSLQANREKQDADE